MKNCQFFAALGVVFLLFFGGTAQAQSLKERIDRILEGSPLARSRHSIQIIALPGGPMLYQRNPDLPLNPASNVKLLTAATALKELGPDFTYRTEFYSESLMTADGHIQDLWIKGFGDPVFVDEEMDSVVKRFVASGLKQIDGRIFVDDTYFDRNDLTTYIADAHEKLYKVMTGPLSYNFNSVPNKSGKGLKGVPNPAIYAGTVFREALRARGVRISGGLSREAVPSGAIVILTHSSPPLREIAKRLNKFSNNFIAEQLIKTLSAVRYGPPGSTARGLELIRRHLVGLGFSRDRFSVDNGSGLSRLTRLSASQILRTLLDAYRAPWRDSFIASLSIAGNDGTLTSKMRGSKVAGKVFAKTGTLNDARALSGYLFDRSRGAAFSFIFNDFEASAEEVFRVEEEILEAVQATF